MTDRRSLDSDGACRDPELGTWVTLWIEGLVSDEEEALALEHVATCPHCAERVGRQRPLLPGVRALEERPVRAARRERLAWTAAAVLAIALLGLWLAWPDPAGIPTPAELDARANRLVQGLSTAAIRDVFRRLHEAGELGPNALGQYAGIVAGFGDFVGAIPLFEEALRIRPDLVIVRHNHARNLVRVGRMEAAVSEFRRVLRDAPSWIDPYAELARALHKAGRSDEALRVLDEGDSLAGTAADRARTLRARAGLVLALGQGVPEAKRLLDEAAASLGNSGELHLVLRDRYAVAVEYENDLAEARRIAVRLNDLRQRGAFGNQPNQLASGRELLARAALETFARQRPGDRALLAEAQGHLEVALRLREEEQNLEGLTRSHELLALLAALRGDDADALTRFTRTIALLDDLGDGRGQIAPLVNRAQVRLRLGDAPGALVDAREALERAQHWNDTELATRAYLAQALALRATGEAAEAEASFEAALDEASRLSMTAVVAEVRAHVAAGRTPDRSPTEALYLRPAHRP
jgi:tetratricopeptide (TPR) repeat protein